MVTTVRTLLVAALGLLPRLVLGASLQVVWDFPRDWAPGPDRFVLTIEHQDGIETLSVVPSAPGACQALAQSSDPNIYCATVAQCPADGIGWLTVQAALGDMVSEPSNKLTCVFSRLLPCKCLDVTTPAANAATVQQVVTAPPPAPPALASFPAFPTLPARAPA